MIMAAVKSSDPGLISVLVNMGADIRYAAADGMTALKLAERKNRNPDVACVLRKLSGAAFMDEPGGAAGGYAAQ